MTVDEHDDEDEFISNKYTPAIASTISSVADNAPLCNGPPSCPDYLGF